MFGSSGSRLPSCNIRLNVCPYARRVPSETLRSGTRLQHACALSSNFSTFILAIWGTPPRYCRTLPCYLSAIVVGHGCRALLSDLAAPIAATSPLHSRQGTGLTRTGRHNSRQPDIDVV